MNKDKVYTACAAVKEALTWKDNLCKEYLLSVLEANPLPGITDIQGDARKEFIHQFGNCILYALTHNAYRIRKYLEKQPLFNNILMNNNKMKSAKLFYSHISKVIHADNECDESDVLWIIEHRMPPADKVSKDEVSESERKECAQALFSCLAWAWDNDATQVIDRIRRCPLYHELLQCYPETFPWVRSDPCFTPIDAKNTGTMPLDLLYIQNKAKTWLENNTQVHTILRNAMDIIEKTPDSKILIKSYQLVGEINQQLETSVQQRSQKRQGPSSPCMMASAAAPSPKNGNDYEKDSDIPEDLKVVLRAIH